MKVNLDQLEKDLHAKLDSGIDHLKSAKAQVEGLSKETAEVIQKKLDEAKDMVGKTKQKAAAAKTKVEDYGEKKKAETESTIAGWKANHERKKLEKRAEQAEKYAESSVDLALYYYTEAQAAILEAIAARKDADEAS
jgi:hypothetical protein